MSEELGHHFDPAELERHDGAELDSDELEQLERQQHTSEEPDQDAGVDWQTEAAAPAQFNYNDRLYALGISRSGKSEFLNVVFSGLTSQRLLLDTKPEFHIEGLEAVHTPEQIDWTAPLIHYQPLPGSDASQYEPIFAVARSRRGITVCAHELAALVDYRPNKAGPYLIGYISQGGALGQGLLAGSNRPVMIPTAGLTEANHVVTFVPGMARREDNAAVAGAVSPVNGTPLSTDELGQELASLHQEQGPHAFLWKDHFRQVLQAFPPLPDEIRRLSIVQRFEDA